MQIINVQHRRRGQAKESRRLVNGCRQERFCPFLAPPRDRSDMRALHISFLRLHIHVRDGVIDVLVEASDVERLQTKVDNDFQGTGGFLSG